MEHIEEMSAFFAKRIEDYEEHMMNIGGIGDAYTLVASLLPENTNTMLDLGCGTGLELTDVFARFPNIHITGIDMTQEMLDLLAKKYPPERMTLVCGDYLSADFGKERFDAALSFQTMHHFTHDTKRSLYRRIRASLRPDGAYVEADYTVPTQAEEDMHFHERRSLLEKMGNPPGIFHYDTPLTPENQVMLLRQAGFTEVRLTRMSDWISVIVSVK
ncbi:MAG: class I SAM-dependent methyltransferase [Clostridia bacterium]|nr:class I SAM-dependent methyltransferase [Clostridia bacterium]